MTQQPNRTRRARSAPATPQPVPQPATVPFAVQAITHAGRVRDHNEDEYMTPERAGISAALRQQRGELVLVADGMGGAAAGEVAAKMTAEGVMRYYYASSAEPRAALRDAIAQANAEVYATQRRNPAQQGMGSTLVAALFLPLAGRVVVANVGDSRLYRLRGDRIEQLTIDHTWVGEKVRRGELTLEEAERHEEKNVIMRAIGADAGVQSDIWEHDLQSGDAFLLCSDGLSNVVGPQEMKLQLLGADLATAGSRLVGLANERGGPDNITVVTVRYGAPDPVTSLYRRRRRRAWMWVTASLVLVVAAVAAALAVGGRFPDLTGGSQQNAATESVTPQVSAAVITPGADAAPIAQAMVTATSTLRPEVAAQGTASSPIQPVAMTVAPTTLSPTATRAASPKSTTGAAPAKLAAPELVAPVDGHTASFDAVNLEWKAVPGAKYYRVETRSDREDQREWQAWGTPKTTSVNLYLAGVPYFRSGTLYYWRVVPVGTVDGPASAVRYFTYDTAPPPTSMPVLTTDTPTAVTPTPEPPPTEPVPNNLTPAPALTSGAPLAPDVSSIEGFVYFDFDGNGLKGPGEDLGIGGVEIELEGNGRREKATTEANGRFAFYQITEGTYTITEEQPAGFISTSPDQVTVMGLPGQRVPVNFGETRPAVTPTFSPTPAATATLTATPTTTATASPTATFTSTSTPVTPTATDMPTSTPLPTETSTPSPTVPITTTPTLLPTLTHTPTPTRTPALTVSPTPVSIYLPTILKRGDGEPNNTFSTAFAIGPGTVYKFWASENDAEDIYLIKVQPSHSIEVWLWGMKADADNNLYLYDSQRGLKAYSGNLKNADEHILTENLTEGEYFVRVRRVAGAGEYFLRAELRRGDASDPS